MRYRLRTLLILMAVGPPLLWVGWTKYEAWQAERKQLRARREWLDQFGVLPPPRVLQGESPPIFKLAYYRRLPSFEAARSKGLATISVALPFGGR